MEPDPSVTTVMKGAEAMRAFQPDWIVAVSYTHLDVYKRQYLRRHRIPAPAHPGARRRPGPGDAELHQDQDGRLLLRGFHGQPLALLQLLSLIHI